MAEHYHRLTTYGSQLCQPVPHQTGADALALSVRTDRHRGQRGRPDPAAVNLDREAAEQDLPDKLARNEGHALDQHEAIMPQPGDEPTFTIASKRGMVQIGNGRVTAGGSRDNLHHSRLLP
jgi:hypothetical protein